MLTILIGGNHEASNHMWELPYGGWVAPNMYYLGFAGVVSYNGVRIGGLSGIYNHRHYAIGHYEAPPFTPGSQRSIYHVRSIDVFQLKLLRPDGMDVFLSHDWPARIAFHGDTAALLRRKSFLREEIYSETLGSPPAEEIMSALRPRFWFAAHMHVKFAAVVRHGQVHGAQGQRDSGQEAAQAHGSSSSGGCGDDGHAGDAGDAGDGGGQGVTRFLALDKCLPRRSFLQLITIPDRDNSGLCYDMEWLTIIRSVYVCAVCAVCAV